MVALAAVALVVFPRDSPPRLPLAASCALYIQARIVL